MRYCLGIDTEERDRCKKIIDEFNNDIGNWDPDWVNDEVKEEYEMWNESVEMALRRLKRAEYFLEYVNARSLKIPVDVNLPIVKSKITKKLFLDLTVFLEECGYKDDNEKNFNRRRFIYISKNLKGSTVNATCISSQYVYDVLDNQKKEFLVNKHLIVPIHACYYVISSVISTVNLRNKKFLEIIDLWFKEYNSLLKNSNTGFKFLKELFDGHEDIPFYQKNELGEIEEVENGMQTWLEEKEKLPSIEEYLTNRNKKEERIKKASENERNELYNDNNN